MKRYVLPHIFLLFVKDHLISFIAKLWMLKRLYLSTSTKYTSLILDEMSVFSLIPYFSHFPLSLSVMIPLKILLIFLKNWDFTVMCLEQPLSRIQFGPYKLKGMNFFRHLSNKFVSIFEKKHVMRCCTFRNPILFNLVSKKSRKGVFFII